MRSVIVNADDFGLSPSINRTIVLAHREGILTSATILANGPAFEEALEIARQNPSLGVGLHLNLCRGRPLMGVARVPSLVDEKTGAFLGSLTKVFWRMISGGFREEEIYVELKAQADKLISAGIFPTHFDSEKHLHHAPRIRTVVVRLAKELGIKKIRAVKEPLGAADWMGLILRGHWEKLTALAVFRNARKEFLKAGLCVTQRSYGFFRPMTLPWLKTTLDLLPEGISEIMCHPGLVGAEERAQMAQHGRFFTRDARGEELTALLDPQIKRRIDREGIRLEHF